MKQPTGDGDGGSPLSGAEHERLAALRACLAPEELDCVLVRALPVLGDAGLDALVRRLPPDTGAALLRALEPGVAHAVGTCAPSSAKLSKDWNDAWADWGDTLAESGYEDGRYVIQEEHWEPPWLDAEAVIADLEPIAGRLVEMVESAWLADVAPDLDMYQVLVDDVGDIGAGLPEWAERPERARFGPQVTALTLAWQWRVARRAGLGAFGLVEQVRRLEAGSHPTSVRRIALASGALASFVCDLEEREQREILSRLTEQEASPLWSEVLDNPSSGWFKARQDLASRWDRRRFVETSRAFVGSDWSLALPLLEEHLSRHEHEEAMALAREATRSYLGLRADQAWDPRVDLFAGHPRARYREDLAERPGRVLRAWRDGARAAGQEDLGRALDVQCLAVEAPADWDGMLTALAAMGAGAKPLYQAWRMEAAGATLRGDPPGDPWIGHEWLLALIDRIRQGADATAFHADLRGWLARLDRTAGGPLDCRGSLSTLTLDLDAAGLLRATRPRFHALLAGRHRSPSPVDFTRRRFVERLKGQAFLPEVLAFWSRHAARLVPDPADAHASNYEDCASWLEGIHDLDPDAARAILGTWSGLHRRRRNLWKAIEARGLG